MTVLFKILSAAGWLLVAAIILLLWVIIVPRHFWVEYSKRDGLIAQVNIAFFRFTIYPLPKFLQKKEEDSKKQAETEKQHTPQQKNTADKKDNPFENIEFSFELVKQVVRAAKGIMKRIFKAIKFRDVSFTIPLHGKDALATQQLYAGVTNAFYSLSIFLQKHLQLYYKSPVFVADFANQHSDATYFYSKITASPVLLLAAAWFAYTQYQSIMAGNQKAQPAAEKENK